MKEMLEEFHFKVTPISKGIAIGPLCFLEDFPDDAIPEFPIPLSDVENEIARYRRAVISSRQDLHDLQRFLAREGSTEAASIIDTHIQMLEDPFMTTFVEKKIRQMMKNTESVFRTVMTDYEKEFSKIKDNFFRQRLLDVKDLSQRILRHLYPHKQVSLKDLPNGILIFTKELVPSLSAEASINQVYGFITEVGGTTSHAALIARSKGIPYVTNIEVETLKNFQDGVAIIDGTAGVVIINPSPATIDHYTNQQMEKTVLIFPEKIKREKQTRTLDGCEVSFHANIESLNDLDLLDVYGASGVGLFRTEFLFFGKELFSFSEEAQFELYKKVMENANGKLLTFRLFDVGGDKGNVRLYEPEPNPALGCRGVRFLLRNKDILVMQLRALLRVSAMGNLRILIPLVSDVTELIAIKSLTQEVALELRKEGYDIANEILIGSMIEVPSAVMICDFLAKECDFLSIGTNDLIQYTLATDRTHQELHSFYKPTHPSIVRMIQKVVEESARYNTPVSLCGEMASDPLMIPLLLALGLRTFSCTSRSIPQIREMAKRLKLSDCQEILKELQTLETCEAIEEKLREHYGKLIE